MWWYHGARWGLLLAVGLVTYFAFPGSSTRSVPVVLPGQTVERDLSAPITFPVMKPQEQLASELAATAGAVAPVFRYQPAAVDSAVASLHATLGDQFRASAAQLLTQDELAWLEQDDHRSLTLRLVENSYRELLPVGVADPGPIAGVDGEYVTVVSGGRDRRLELDSVITLPQLLARVESLAATMEATAGRVFRKILVAHYRPTLVPDPAATTERRTMVLMAVDSVKRLVPRGTVILRAGEPASASAVEELAALRAAMSRQSPEEAVVRRVLAPLLVNVMILGVFWLLVQYYRPEVYRHLRHLALIAGLLILVVAASAALMNVAPGRPELFPVPLAAIVVSILFGGRLAIVVVAMLALLLASQEGLRDGYALLLCLVTGVAAALAVDNIRRHNQAITAAGIICGAGAIAMATVALMEGWSAPEFTASVLLIGVGVLGSAAVALILLPVAEYLTRITSDLSLVGLADPTRPLLRRLATEAPGTWAHSLTIASLAESACNAIGANGLLARVGCYYHDVGKLEQPQYFVENQGHGANPHDLISPARSAELIRRHVPDGMRLAREARLPPEVAAFITEHHGTSRIQYFLHRAREQDPGEPVEEASYRYPGPRPQSVETAVVMLADSAEAGVKVLGRPSAGQIREAIDHIVKRRLDEGELSQAPITLEQIDLVKDELVRALGGVLHSRVEYPRESLPPVTSSGPV